MDKDVGLGQTSHRGRLDNPLSSLKRCERHRFSAEECARRALSEGVRGGGKKQLFSNNFNLFINKQKNRRFNYV